MAKQWDPLTDIPNVSNKVIVVTGGTCGIGFSTVKFLARRGAKVYFTTRTRSKAEKTKEALLASDSNIKAQNVEWLLLDFFDPTSINDAAEELKMKERKLDVLSITPVNNAAAATSSTDLVAGGYEQHMVANHMGPFLFTNRVLPLLKNALKENRADVRIISLSSTAQTTMLPHNFQFQFESAVALKDPVPTHPWQWRYGGRFMFGFDMVRYAVSKVAIAMFIRELQRRLEEQGYPIICLAVHPGEVLTETLLELNNSLVKTIARMSFVTSDQGAATPVFAATASEVRNNAEKYKGKFILPIGKVESPNPVVEDENQVRGLWLNTTIEVNKQLLAHNLPLLQDW